MIERRSIGVLTTGRQDYGILRSTLLLLRDHPELELRLYVGGMHLKERFGRSVQRIRLDQLPIAAELDFLGEPPNPPVDASRTIELLARVFQTSRPNSLLLVGDRFETLAAGVAATLANIPLIHLHGGEETEGAIDNAMRHALTKLSHLHLVSHERHARRVLQMGEDAAQVVVVGAAGLDNLHRADLPDRWELERQLEFSLEDPVVMVTMHSTTLGMDPLVELEAVCQAMSRVPAQYVVSQPNADPGSQLISDYWRQWSADRENVLLVDALGDTQYWGLLGVVAAMLGNSSSGIIEGPAAGLPVVNVGDRQKGRLRSPELTNDVAVDADLITAALREVLKPTAQKRPRRASSQYPAGQAAPKIVAAIDRWKPQRPVRKRFVDATSGATGLFRREASSGASE